MSKLRNKIFNGKFKLFSLNVGVVSIFTFLQIYWSNGKLSDQMSSSCMTCSFLEDAVWMSLITGIFLSLCLLIIKFLNDDFMEKAITFISLVCVWVYWNYAIFVDRESSWSSYDFASEMHYTLTGSFFAVFLLGFITVIILSKIEKNFKFEGQLKSI